VRDYVRVGVVQGDLGNVADAHSTQDDLAVRLRLLDDLGHFRHALDLHGEAAHEARLVLPPRQRALEGAVGEPEVVHVEDGDVVAFALGDSGDVAQAQREVDDRLVAGVRRVGGQGVYSSLTDGRKST